MQGEADVQVRAWVDYFRDLGVYDFYRRGEFATLTPVEEVGVNPVQAEAVDPLVRTQSAVSVAIADSAANLFEPSPPPAHPASDLGALQTMRLVSFNKLAPLPAGPIPVVARAAIRPCAHRAWWIRF